MSDDIIKPDDKILNIVKPNDELTKNLEMNIQANLELAKVFLKTGWLPKAYTTPEQVYLVMAKGREIGIPPLNALSHIFIVDGTPSMRAELMLQLVLRMSPHVRIGYGEQNKRRVVVIAKRYPDFPPTEFEWTWEMAQQAGLTDKKCWKQYPEAMLRWRAVSAMARALFADALQGISYTPEELGYDTNSDGIPVGISPQGPKETIPVETDSVPEVIDYDEPSTSDEERAKLEKLKNLMLSPAVGLDLQTLESMLGKPFSAWSVTDRILLETAAMRLKKSFTPEKNRELIELVLVEKF